MAHHSGWSTAGDAALGLHNLRHSFVLVRETFGRENLDGSRGLNAPLNSSRASRTWPAGIWGGRLPLSTLEVIPDERNDLPLSRRVFECRSISC